MVLGTNGWEFCKTSIFNEFPFATVLKNTDNVAGNFYVNNNIHDNIFKQNQVILLVFLIMSMMKYPKNIKSFNCFDFINLSKQVQHNLTLKITTKEKSDILSENPDNVSGMH